MAKKSAESIDLGEMMRAALRIQDRSWSLREAKLRAQKELPAVDMVDLLRYEQHPKSVLLPWLKKAFLEEYERHGTMTAACRRVGIKVADVRRWVQSDPQFAEAYQDADDSISDDLEEEAIARAKEGSENLLMFLLKNRKPGKFKDIVVNVHEHRHEIVDGARSKLKARLDKLVEDSKEEAKQLAAGETVVDGADVEILDSGDDDDV